MTDITAKSSKEDILTAAIELTDDLYQQKLCHFKPDTATVHAQWVAIRTYSYVPPRPPEPMTRRRMLRRNAIEASQTMQKTGWRRCPPPVR